MKGECPRKKQMKVKLRMEAGTEAAMAVGLYQERNIRSVKVRIVCEAVDATSGSVTRKISPNPPSSV